MSKTTYYQKTRDVILNRAKDYYKNDEERSRDNARDKYRNLSEEENNKKREHGRNRYYNMSKQKKQKLKEYQRNDRNTNESKKTWFYGLNKVCYVFSHILLNL